MLPGSFQAESCSGSGNHGWVSELVLTPDRSRAYFTNSFGGEVWGVDLATGQVADSLTYPCVAAPTAKRANGLAYTV